MEEAAPQLMDLVGISKWLGVRTHWVKREAEAGRIASIMVDGERMFDPAAVMAGLHVFGAVNLGGKPHPPIKLVLVTEFWRQTPFGRARTIALFDEGQLPCFDVGGKRYCNFDLCYALLDGEKCKTYFTAKLAKSYYGYLPDEHPSRKHLKRLPRRKEGGEVEQG